MAKSISVRLKKRGRPATGKMPTTTLRLPEKLSGQIDAWANKQADAPGHSEAIRRLVELGLTVKTISAPSERQRAALADLASKAIDSLIVGTPNNDEKAGRKRRLIKGPEEFREDRVDRPKAKGK